MKADSALGLAVNSYHLASPTLLRVQVLQLLRIRTGVEYVLPVRDSAAKN